jgi:hypothetical protein
MTQQEQEKEVKARKDQQIEVEKFVDREYSRQEEKQRPWPFSVLRHDLKSCLDANDKGKVKGMAGSSGSNTLPFDHPFYRLRDFKLRHQEPLPFPDCVHLSSNYFNPNWTGLRRAKNVIVVMEYVPSTSPSRLKLLTVEEHKQRHDLQEAELSERQRENRRTAFEKAHTLLGFHAHKYDGDGKSGSRFINREDMRNAIQAVTDAEVEDDVLTKIVNEYGDGASGVNLCRFRDLLISGRLQPEEQGRYWVAVSLAEAETLRRILHVKGGNVNRNMNSVKGCAVASSDGMDEMEFALRYSPMSTPKAPVAGDAGWVLDASQGWQRKQQHQQEAGYSGGPSASGKTKPTQSSTHALATEPYENQTGVQLYQAALAHTMYRFFDCDMHFGQAALNIMLRGLQQASVRDREMFFQVPECCLQF